MQSTLRKSGAALALAALIGLGGIGQPAGAQNQPEPPPFGPVSALAIDNVGGGWGWTGPRDQNDAGHILRLENGDWREVLRDGREAGALGRAAALYDIELSGDGRQGWAIGAGAGQQIYQLRDGNWLTAENPFPPDWTLTRGLSPALRALMPHTVARAASNGARTSDVDCPSARCTS